jgi:hypothetical protein
MLYMLSHLKVLMQQSQGMGGTWSCFKQQEP